MSMMAAIDAIANNNLWDQEDFIRDVARDLSVHGCTKDEYYKVHGHPEPRWNTPAEIMFGRVHNVWDSYMGWLGPPLYQISIPT